MNILGSMYDGLMRHYEEEYQLVKFIRQFLLTPEQKAKLEEWNITIEDILNGRIEGDLEGTKYNYFFDAWNEKLGKKAFGFDRRGLD